MRAIDVDPEVLETYARASIHAGDEGWRHLDAEIVGDVPNLMTTLTPEGPYAYTIMPEVHADGSVVSPILTTREEIHEAYKIVRGRSWIHNSEALIEIRAPWYQFTESVSTSQIKGQDKINHNHLITLFPLGQGGGITGELVWVKVPRERMGAGERPEATESDELTLRRDILALHEAYVDALTNGDVDSMLATFTDGAQGAVRDYVAETGTLVALDGLEANAAYYQAFFDKFEMLSVDLLQRSAQEWYVFAELRVVARVRETGQNVAFNIAEFFVPARDGRFIIRVGHGTDPEISTDK